MLTNREVTHLTLKMEAVLSSEKLVSYHITTCYHYPEDYILSLHHPEILKSAKREINFF
jgi:histidinol phosphatase-like enzyme